MAVAAPEEHREETVVRWLQRLIPFCPRCGKLMFRRGKGRVNKKLLYYQCNDCGITGKTIDRLRDAP